MIFIGRITVYSGLFIVFFTPSRKISGQRPVPFRRGPLPSTALAVDSIGSAKYLVVPVHYEVI
jgi:hypothetical protein